MKHRIIKLINESEVGKELKRSLPAGSYIGAIEYAVPRLIKLELSNYGCDYKERLKQVLKSQEYGNNRLRYNMLEEYKGVGLVTNTSIRIADKIHIIVLLEVKKETSKLSYRLCRLVNILYKRLDDYMLETYKVKVKKRKVKRVE